MKTEHLEAVRRLVEMRGVLNGMAQMLDQMTEAASSVDAQGLAFASQMLREATTAFQDELTKYVAKKISE